MGMAYVDVYSKTRIRKRGGTWRATWCDIHNQLWYREFYSWAQAIQWATTGKLSERP